MTRLNLLLLLALVAQQPVPGEDVSYESRRLFAELDRAQSEERRLDSEYKRLEAERQAQATHLRVEKVAREQARRCAPRRRRSRSTC